MHPPTVDFYRRLRRLRRMLILLCCLGLASPLAASPLLIELRGEPAPGALLIGRTGADVSVQLDGRPLEVDSDGYFLFGFDRDASGEAELLLQRGQQRQQHTVVLQPRQWQMQRIKGVPARTVTPPPEALTRIRNEAALVRAARQQRSALTAFRQQFVWPASGRISGVYGSQRVYNGEPGRPHFGVDIAAPTGSPVIAPAAGIVSLVHADMFYSGGTLIIDHGLGLSSTFIHLHQVLVEQGQQVEQGEVIAEIGASGRATGPHLDWRLNWYQMRLDPQWFIGGTTARAVQAGTHPAP